VPFTAPAQKSFLGFFATRSVLSWKRLNLSKVLLLLMAGPIWHGFVLPTVATAEQANSMSVEDALRTHKLADLMAVSVSPDVKYLAYTIQDNQRTKSLSLETLARTGVPPWASGTDIFILKIEDHDARNLTRGVGDNWLPVWSPNGHYLAFLSDRDSNGQARLWVWDAMRDELRKVSDVDVRGGEIQWTPDSKKLLITTLPEKLSIEDYVKRLLSNIMGKKQVFNKAPDSTVVLYWGNRASTGEESISRSDPWNLDINLRDLVSIDANSGKAAPIVAGKRIGTFLLSPDGSRIAYSVPTHFEKPGSQQILFDLGTISIATNREQILGSNIRLDYDGASFSWSPDGSRISFHTGGGEEKNFDCFVVEVESGTTRNVTTLPPMASGRKSSRPLWDGQGHIYFLHQAALWRASVSQSKASEVARIPKREITQLISKGEDQMWITDDARSTMVVTHDTSGKQDGFYSIDLAGGRSGQVLEMGQCYTCANVDEPFFVTKDSRGLIYFAEDAEHESDLWMSDKSFQHPRRLTHVNPQLDKYRMGSPRVVNWLSDDGDLLQGALLLPVGYEEGRRYPLIVWVYGGESLSDNFDHFGFGGMGVFNMQLLSTRGYAALFPDSPQRVGTPLLDLVKTVLPGVNRVIEMGIADPDRLGLMGHSNGGYGTLALIGQTKRFRAAIEMDGIGNLLGAYGALDKSGAAFGTSNLENGQNALGGTPWNVRNRYIENSPIFYMDRVETPLLIIHGSEDRAVAPFLGDEVFVALRRLGKQVEYAKYQGEDHSPLYWSYTNQSDLSHRIIEWFDRHLKASQ